MKNRDKKNIGAKESIKLLEDQGIHVTVTFPADAGGRVVDSFLLTGKSGKQFLIMEDGIHRFNKEWFTSQGGKIVERKRKK